MNDWNETAFMPAEAATEVGADQPTPADRRLIRRGIAALCLFWLAVGLALGLL